MSENNTRRVALWVKHVQKALKTRAMAKNTVNCVVSVAVPTAQVMHKLSLYMHRGTHISKKREHQLQAKRVRQAGITLLRSSYATMDAFATDLRWQVGTVFGMGAAQVYAFLRDPDCSDGDCHSYAPDGVFGLLRPMIARDAETLVLTLGDSLVQCALRADSDTCLIKAKGQIAETLCVAPIVSDGQIMGILCIAAVSSAREFLRAGVDAVSQLAEFAAVAWMNTRRLHVRLRREADLEQHMAERTRELETLLTIANSLSSSLSLDELLAKFMAQLRQVVPFDSSAIFARDGDENLRMLMYQGPPSSLVKIGSIWPVSHHFKMVVEQQQAVIIPDTRSDSSAARIWMDQIHAHLNGNSSRHIVTWMGVPIIAHDRVIGLLTLDRSIPNAYTPAHASLATAVAQQAGLAMERFGCTQIRCRLLPLLNAIVFRATCTTRCRRRSIA